MFHIIFEYMCWILAWFFALIIPAWIIIPVTPWGGGNTRSVLRDDRIGFNKNNFEE